MNLHEYQGKEILKSFGIKIPLGIVVNTPDKAVAAAKKIQAKTGTKFWAIKAQIHAGGRSKGGGIRIAKSLDEVKKKTSEMLGMNLVTPQTYNKGKLVRQAMITEDVYYPEYVNSKEYYISIIFDRKNSINMIIYSSYGGRDIEDIAYNTPNKIYKEDIDPCIGLQEFQARKMAFNLGFKDKVYKEFIQFILSLLKAYLLSDAILVEINPLLQTFDSKLLAVDTKVVLDDNALYRHPNYAVMRDIYEEDPLELEASKAGLSFVKLDGNIGCIVNGAGLAMATMDLIHLLGGNPANFLDIGGNADSKIIKKAFEILLKDKDVEVILINIFGGIVRCDSVAKGIIDTYKSNVELKVPIVVRLQGTNYSKAQKMLDNSGYHIQTVFSLQEVAEKVCEIIS